MEPDPQRIHALPQGVEAGASAMFHSLAGRVSAEDRIARLMNRDAVGFGLIKGYGRTTGQESDDHP